MEMASWFKEPSVKDGFIFVTDAEVIAHHEGSRSINWNDFVGHHGIMEVYNMDDGGRTHYEGFVQMPDVIRKTVLSGAMDMLFAHADNLREATPEFIPMMHRLSKHPKVAAALAVNPYRDWHIEKGQPTLAQQMRIGISNGFTGSTIGEILRHPLCDEDTMMVALNEAASFMDEYPEHHHYRNIVDNPHVTKKVLQHVLKVVPHTDVKAWAEERLKNCKDLKLTKVNLAKRKVKTHSLASAPKAVVRSL